jgi:hypothetical protein
MVMDAVIRTSNTVPNRQPKTTAMEDSNNVCYVVDDTSGCCSRFFIVFSFLLGGVALAKTK